MVGKVRRARQFITIPKHWRQPRWYRSCGCLATYQIFRNSIGLQFAVQPFRPFPIPMAIADERFVSGFVHSVSTKPMRSAKKSGLRRIDCSIDFTHAADTDLVGDFIRAKARTRSNSHHRSELPLKDIWPPYSFARILLDRGSCRIRRVQAIRSHRRSDCDFIYTHRPPP